MQTPPLMLHQHGSRRTSHSETQESLLRTIGALIVVGLMYVEEEYPALVDEWAAVQAPRWGPGPRGHEVTLP